MRLLSLLLLLLPLAGWGQAFTATYPFTGVTTTSGTTDPTPVPTAPGVTFGAFTAVGMSANPNAASRFSFTLPPTGATNGSDTFTGSLDPTKYYSVTLTPVSGSTLSVSGLYV